MAIALPSLFGRSSPPLVGIDLSASSVKVVELAKGQRTPMRLERYAIEPIERGAIVDGNIEKPEAVAEALTRALRKCNTRAREAALALPAGSVITKKILVPAGLREEDYEIQVEAEASQYIPFPIEEVNLDFQLLGPAKGSEDEIEVLLAASRKEKVDDRVAVAEMSGLHPVVMDVESYALRSAVDHVTRFLPNNGQGQIIAVFTIGQTTTSLAVVLNEQTVFEREQLQPFIEQGATDIARALQFFFTSTPYTRVDQIYLAGGSSVVPGLADAVMQRTQVPTEILSPFQGMEVSDAVRDRQLRADAPALLVAAGLAMRRFDA